MKMLAALALAVLAVAPASAADRDLERLAADGRVALDIGAADDAIRLLEKAAASAPQDADIRFDRAWAWVEAGWLSFQAGDYAGAYQGFSKAVKAEPSIVQYIRDAYVYTTASEIVAALNLPSSGEPARRREMLRAAEEIVRLTPSSDAAHYALGRVYQVEGRLDEARAQYLAGGGQGLAGGDNSLEALRAATEALAARPVAAPAPVHPLFAGAAQAGGEELEPVQTSSFVVHHSNEAVGRRVAAVLEYYLDQPILGQVLKGDPELPANIHVYLYSDSAAFQSVRNAAENPPFRAVRTYRDRNIVVRTYPDGQRVEMYDPEWNGPAAGVEGLAGRFSPLPAASIYWHENSGRITHLEMALDLSAPGLLYDSAPQALARLRTVTHWGFKENSWPAWLECAIDAGSLPSWRRERLLAAAVQARRQNSLIPSARLLDDIKLPSRGVAEYPVAQAECALLVEALTARGGPVSVWQFASGLSPDDSLEKAFDHAFDTSLDDLDQLLLDSLDRAAAR